MIPMTPRRNIVPEPEYSFASIYSCGWRFFVIISRGAHSLCAVSHLANTWVWLRALHQPVKSRCRRSLSLASGLIGSQVRIGSRKQRRRHRIRRASEQIADDVIRLDAAALLDITQHRGRK